MNTNEKLKDLDNGIKALEKLGQEIPKLLEWLKRDAAALKTNVDNDMSMEGFNDEYERIDTKLNEEFEKILNLGTEK